MSILPQHNHYLTRSPAHNPWHRKRIICSATTTPTKPKPSPNQLTFEPQFVTPPNLVTSISTPPVLNDPSLQSTWSHRTWVATGCTTVLVSLAKAIAGAGHSHIWLEPMLAGYIGYILADLGSGVYHWGIDNYGDGSTPIFGNQIEAFQGHHKWPWTITRRQFANNLHALARTVAFFVLPVDLVCNDPTVNALVGVCSGCIMFSQQFHAWAHGTKSKLPPIVVALQDVGLLVSRSQHGAHHRQPYNNNYCIVSGVWNEFLDKNKVFEALEMALYFKLGVRPRSWSEPTTDWTEETETASQVAVQ
ncbi:fatty acid desaturase 4, chloroplastic [Populus nigra]|uniref:fatty acid desaturase 4, chloroplastic n=1 Tax=Populus nigra TaxID=3691 RepID=UPI002B2778B2|nr:fatty acid desaturase 4, chloroplastic [Populus nigra]